MGGVVDRRSREAKGDELRTLWEARPGIRRRGPFTIGWCPPYHFLRKLKDLLPSHRFRRKLVRLYLGKARKCRPPCAPAVFQRMPLAHLYHLFKRQSQEVVNYHLPVK